MNNPLNLSGIILLVLFFLANSSEAITRGPKLSDGMYDPAKPQQQINKHNLSSKSNSVYKASSGDPLGRDEQICVFCHTPHNSVPQSTLWNRKDTTRTFFDHYSSRTLVIDNPNVRSKSQYFQGPNGSSRLCMSCHDGMTALGAVWVGGSNIPFPANMDKIAYLNMSSHHPVSFVYDQSVLAAITLKKMDEGYQVPRLNSAVKLDKLSRMQCTSCHDPHQDQSDQDAKQSFIDVNHRDPWPFWVGDDHDSVCMECHYIRPLPSNP